MSLPTRLTSLAKVRCYWNSNTYVRDTGKRYSTLNFHKAPSDEVKEELGKVNLETMEELSKSCQTSALSEFHEKVLDVLEPLLPLKPKKLSAKMGMMRRLRRRRLS